MKIVRIIARLNVGGPARHVVWLTEGLQPPDYETLLVAGTVPPGEDDMSYFAAENGVVPHIIPQMSREISPRDALTVWKLYRLLKRERPHVVHTHTAKAGTVGRVSGMLYRWLTPAALIGRPRPCRFVHTYHGHIFHSYYGRFKTRLFLSIERTLARLATDRIVVISRQQYQEIHEEFKVGRSLQFRIIPLGLDVSRYADWERRRELLRTELGAGHKDVLVGIVGRLTEVKNHALFLRAVARYKETRGLTNAGGGRALFVVVGDGHLRAVLEAEARSLGVEQDVRFLGTRNDPENFYPALDIVALTSLNEGTPLTLIEAMANARPLIATAVGGVVDLLGEAAAPLVVDESDALDSKDGAAVLCERGVKVAPNDEEAFCRGLARLITDEGLRRELGERGRRFVGEQYSKERLLADVKKLYAELAVEATTAASPERSPEVHKQGERGVVSSEHRI
ncbi:MAG TPA: glycosyltransferase [Pyrinomonadaceae bacterium]|jgi:glycosyltransferase involved in cell wall biosynthesis